MDTHEQAKPLIWVDTTTIGSCANGLASFSVTFPNPLRWQGTSPITATWYVAPVPEHPEESRTRRALALLKTWEKLA